jgi:hypothetical protein
MAGFDWAAFNRSQREKEKRGKKKPSKGGSGGR